MNDTALAERACKAWRRSGGYDIPAGGGDVIRHQDRHYVVLSNVRGTLAVYRITGTIHRERLKRLKRWPKAVAPA